MTIPQNNTYTIAGVGEILWDMLPDGRQLGGAPANFALHAKAFGANAKIVSAIGQDPAGMDILSQLANRQADTQYILKNSYPTGTVDVQLCGNGHPTYIIHENSAWDNIELTPGTIQMAQTCSAVCFGTLAQRNPVSRNSIHRFLASTPETCLRVFDINLRQHYYSKEIIEKSLQAANVFKLNSEELIVLQDLLDLPKDTESAIKTLRDQYELDLVALTQGEDGSTMIDRENTSYCPTVPVAVKDTIGAGDSFTATMTMAKIQGLPLERINVLASKVAGYVCSQAGATPDLPDFLIADLRHRNP